MLVQRVVMPDEVESWTVVDDSFDVVAPVEQFLAHQAVIERSPETVRSYAVRHARLLLVPAAARSGVDCGDAGGLGHFVGWLRLPPNARNGLVVTLPSVGPHCSASTINRKLSAVAMFYEFHARHGVDCGELLTVLRPGGLRGRWRPFLAHLGSDGQRRKAIKLKATRRLPKTLTADGIETVLGCWADSIGGRNTGILN
jgi:hypothetical protein